MYTYPSSMHSYTLIFLLAMHVAGVKFCVEMINYGFSTYYIDHTVFEVADTVQTIGHGYHDVGALGNKSVIRRYNLRYDLFPASIYRDANNVSSSPVDEYLLFNKEYRCDLCTDLLLRARREPI